MVLYNIRRPPTEVGAPATGRVLLFLPTVHSYGGGSAPNDGHLCLLYTSLLVDKHPPSIFTLRDFVAAFAGLFLRRLCDLPFYTFGFNITRDYCVNITINLVFESHHTPAVYFTVGMN